MRRVHTCDFHENHIQSLADFIKQNYSHKDLSRLAIVFGGRRPSLFLKKELGKRHGKAFFSPVFFTIDEFVYYIVSQQRKFNAASDLDLCYFLYKSALERPHLLKGRKNFADFLPWAYEILSFMEQADLEKIPSQRLRAVQENAQIGYTVPHEINLLLENIVALRESCHQFLDQEGLIYRGLAYLKASQAIHQIEFPEFDDIIFGNLFYLHATEQTIIKDLYNRQKAVLFFQGDAQDWPMLKRLEKELAISIHPDSKEFHVKNSLSPVHLYEGTDVHAQIALVREILKKMNQQDPFTQENSVNTVLVLPETDHVVPLLSEITSFVKDLNVSMGYPLKRSSFFSLLDYIFQAQASLEGNRYYTKDYLKVLRHPFVKNLELAGQDRAVTRILIHKIEEILIGQIQSDLSGSLFIKLEDVENAEALFESSLTVIQRMKIDISKAQLKAIVIELHQIVFRSWKDINRLSQLAVVLEKFLDIFLNKSFLNAYPLNLKMAARILDLIKELQELRFSQEIFAQEDLFKIFQDRIAREMVAFMGSPLKGVQVLGLFETRSLNFERVIVMDVNEGVLPRLKILEPLIPREVMVSLNLDRFEQEEEIQRYQLMRLVQSAKEIHLVYEKSRDKERSRFIEELIWQEEKDQNQLDVIKPIKSNFSIQVTPKKTAIKKSPEILEFLREFQYSASSVNTYLRCPLRFYFLYVLGLSEKEDFADEPENKEVGTFVHGLLEEIYKPFLGRVPVLNEHFRKTFQKKLDERFEQEFGKKMKAESFLLKKVLDVRLNRFLDQEEESKALRDVAEIMSIEQRFFDQIPFDNQKIRFVYKVDRIDRLTDNSILILDYKTGSNDPMPKSLQKISAMTLTRENVKETIRSFQIPLYYNYFSKRHPDQKVKAAFYNLRTLEIDEFLGGQTEQERTAMIEHFSRTLNFVLQEILNPEVQFRPDDSEPRYCATCPYFNACR